MVNKFQESPIKFGRNEKEKNDKEKIITNFRSPNERKFSNSPSISLIKGQSSELGEFRLELKSK